LFASIKALNAITNLTVAVELSILTLLTHNNTYLWQVAKVFTAQGISCANLLVQVHLAAATTGNCTRSGLARNGIPLVPMTTGRFDQQRVLLSPAL